MKHALGPPMTLGNIRDLDQRGIALASSFAFVWHSQ
jgi:hypothetical protein